MVERSFGFLITTLALWLSAMSSSIGAEQIQVFGNEQRPPKIWKEGIESKGILVDILKLLEPEVGVEFKVLTYPWPRALHKASSEEGAIVGFSKTPERLEEFDYSAPLYYDSISLVVKKGHEFNFDKASDLFGKRIGTCGGCSFGDEYETAKLYFSVVENNHAVGRLKMVLSDRLDATILGSGEAELKLLCEQDPRLNIDDFVVLEKPLAYDPNFIAFKKTMNKTALLSKIDRALARKLRSGEIETVLKKYL